MKIIYRPNLWQRKVSMSLIKVFRKELKLGNASKSKDILNKMIQDGYPKTLIKSVEKELKVFLEKGKKQKKIAPDKSIVLIISSPGDKMTNYYRSNFLNEILQVSNNYEPRLTNTIDVTKQMIIEANIIYISRGGVKKDLLQVLELEKEKGKIILFDVDDYVFDENIVQSIRHISESPKRLADIQKHAVRLSQIANLSDVVLTSTYFLSRCAAMKFGKPTYVIPNVIKNNIMNKSKLLTEKREARQTKHIRLGYFSGTKSHEEDFNQISDVIYDLMKARNDIEFLVCGELNVDHFKEFGSRFIKIPLQNYDKMHEYLSTIHINLAPLEIVNIFVHGKSELKIFDAAIYSIPTLASRTDSYASIIVDGFNGYICDDSQDWRSKIVKLLDNTKEIKRLGVNARDTLAQRFYEDVVKDEYYQLLDSLTKNSYRKYYPQLNSPYLCIDKINIFAFSLVTILYKKEKELPYFLESLRRQEFDYPFELIVVNDCTPDQSVQVLDDFKKIYKSLPGTNKNLQISLVNLKENIGNCEARNIGIIAAQSDIVSIVDADCVLNRTYVKAHYDAHAFIECDVAIGPKGIETNGKHPLHVLSLVDISEDFSINNASPQDANNQASFINTVTRNLSFRKSKIIKLIGEIFFDKAFSYSKNPNSGFGWEDVEFGVRLHKAGANFLFLNKSASIHISHDPTENSGDKAFRSLKNFNRLIDKHPDLKYLSRIWYVKTLDAIESWCLKTDQIRYDNESKINIKKLKLDDIPLAETRNVSKSYGKFKKIKIITSRWHCPHQYELYKLGCEFYLLKGFNNSFFNEWEYRKRPLPFNAKFIDLKDLNASEYDLSIIHFDENVLRPELCNGKVPMEWGDAFKFLSTLDLPKIYLCHGTPQFYGQYNGSCNEKLFGAEISESKKQLVDFIADQFVVCNSLQAKNEWGFKNSGVVYHGFTASEFSYFNPNNDARFKSDYLRVLSLPNNALLARPLYNGLDLYSKIIDSVDKKRIKIENLTVQDPSRNSLLDISLWAQFKYRMYASEIFKYNCYLNTTNRSPMPRTRAESMISGSIAITTPYHDIDKFIKNGENGFLINNSTEVIEIFNLLLDDKYLRKKISIASYETALDAFSQERYLSFWVDLITKKLSQG